MGIKDLTVENEQNPELREVANPEFQQETPLESRPGRLPEKKPFHQRCWFTATAVLIISVCYGLTTYSNEFQAPSRLAVALGAFYPPAVHDGQWWRYITAGLLHGNPGHWFNNVAGLLIFGNMLEPVIGPIPLMGLYAISAFGGLWLSSIFLPDGVTYGASTIDFGLIGAYFTLMLLLRLQTNKKAFLKELQGSVMFVLLFVIWNTMESATINVWGHLGGFFAGVLFMLGLWKIRDKSVVLPKG